MPQADLEALAAAVRQAGGVISESSRQLAALMRPGLLAAGQVLQDLEDTLDAQWPQWREFAAAVPDYVPEPPSQGCHCLCGVAHGGYGACVADAEPGLVVAGHLDGVRLDIAVCRTCYEARALVAS